MFLTYFILLIFSQGQKTIEFVYMSIKISRFQRDRFKGAILCSKKIKTRALFTSLSLVFLSKTMIRRNKTTASLVLKEGEEKDEVEASLC